MIDAIAQSLRTITHPRFYETERGFQGEFLVSLRRVLPDIGLPGDAIVEQEYQKRVLDHGIKIRPDIIIHVPTPSGSDRRRGNFVAFELKLAARTKDALEDFGNLDEIIAALDYPLGIFVNIASAHTYADIYGGRFPDRIRCFAVQLAEGGVRVRHACFDGTGFVERD